MNPEIARDPLERSRVALAASHAPGITATVRALHVGVARLCLSKAKDEVANLEPLVAAREAEIARTTRVDALQLEIDGAKP